MEGEQSRIVSFMSLDFLSVMPCSLVLNSAVQIFTQLKFAANVAKWSVKVSFSHFTAELTHVVADKNILVRIKYGKPEKTLDLNFGETLDVEVEV